MSMKSGLPKARSARRSLALLALAALSALACDGRSGSTPELKVTTRPADAPPPTPAATTAAAPLATPGLPAPRPVAFDPPNGSTDVDPARAALAVTFDRAMDPEGWAWVIERPETAPDLGDSSWNAEHTTNTVQARLEPGRSYVLWVNSPQFSYFKGTDGTPATPVRWTFTTRGTPAGAAGSPPPLVSGHDGAPRVVALEPANGATNVDPALPRVRATFDRAMDGSWSWVRESESTFPATTGPAAFEGDGRTAYLPVRLEPGRTYVIWLNSEEFQLFRDTAGRPAPPLRWTFTTAPAR